MNNEPSYRKKFIPGDHGPHHNPWIIDIDAAQKQAAKCKGNWVFFAMLFLAAFFPMYLCDFNFECGWRRAPIETTATENSPYKCFVKIDEQR